MNNFLFLFDKNCSMRPELGRSTHHIHLLSTFDECQPDFNVHTLHYDESALIYGRHIDQILVPYCRTFKINYCFICFNGESEWNPSQNQIKRLKDELGIKIIVCYSDTNACDIEYQNKLKGIVDLSISIDYPKKDGRDLATEGILRLWTPQSQNLYFPQEQDINVSFVGSPRYEDRALYVNQLKEKVPGFFTTGGQRECRLSFEKYASYIRRSKIGINFSGNPSNFQYSQLKGRVFEIIGSRSLLLEEKNLSTRDFFTPGIDYVEFENILDLIEKIDYYRRNEGERLKIAESGYNKFKKNWTAAKFWQKVMEKLI